VQETAVTQTHPTNVRIITAVMPPVEV